jgi:hypothetical protein
LGPKRQLLKGNQAQHVPPATIPELLEYSFAVHHSSDARASFPYHTTYINDVGVSVLFQTLTFYPALVLRSESFLRQHWYIAGQVEPATGFVANGKDVSAIVALQV